jgi:hypothetical protein
MRIQWQLKRRIIDQLLIWRKCVEDSRQMFHVQQQIFDEDVFIGGMNLLKRIAAAERGAIHFIVVKRLF